MAKKKKKKMTPENIMIHRLQKQIFRCTDEIIKNTKKFDVFEQEKNNKQYLANCLVGLQTIRKILSSIAGISLTMEISECDEELLDPQLYEKGKQEFQNELEELLEEIDKL